MSAADHIAAVLPESPDVSLDGQTRSPEQVFTGPDALRQAVASDAEWVWLLAPGSRPEGDALERLLEKVTPGGDPAASLVAGVVRDHAGRMVEDLLPAPGYTDAAAIVRLVAQRSLPVRHTPFANCLIRRSDFVRYGLPDLTGLGPYAATAWTAHLLRTEPGYLAPLSVIRVDIEPPRTRPRDLLSTVEYAVRLNRSGTWTKGESLRAVAAAFGKLRR